MNNEFWGSQPDPNENDQVNVPEETTGYEPEIPAEEPEAPEYEVPKEEPSYNEPPRQEPQYGQNQSNPYAHYYTNPPEPPRKKKNRVLPIVLGMIAVLIIGCAAGGIGIYAYMGGFSEQETESLSEETVEESVVSEAEELPPIETEDAFNTTTIDITTNSTSNELTPQDVFEHYVNAVVAISNEATVTNIFGQVSATASSGSGMIISSDGYILTNNHVVDGAEHLTVTMTSGEEYEAEIIGRDADNDVALIKIEATELPTVSIGDSGDIQVGEQVCAIGNPLGELTNTLTVGYISALDREINEDETPINMFQTDCAINSGNSGGPIFDMNGNVVGITTAKYSAYSSSGAAIEGIGFCIPINDAMDIVADLLEYGYVRGRASLGIQCQAIPSTVTQYYNFPTGIYVNVVEEGSAAEAAGLKEADIITAMDGIEVSSVSDLKGILRDHTAGDEATLTVFRSEVMETLEIKIILDEKVSTPPAEAEEPAQEETEEQQSQNPGQFGQQGGTFNPFFPFGMY